MPRSTDPRVKRRAVFLDRDGVINLRRTDNGYVTSPSEFAFLPGVFEALSILRGLGFLLVVVTNQRGIARGLMTEEDLELVHGFMTRRLVEKGIVPDAIYHCPHEEFEGCPCRKPQPGMILDAIARFGVDPSESYMVGDSPSDVAAGRAAGTRTVRIGEEQGEADCRFPDLLEFARFMLSKSNQSCREDGPRREA